MGRASSMSATSIGGPHVKNLAGWLRTVVEVAVIALTVAAFVRELRRPRAERTWQGRIARVPYDFRTPSLSRLRSRVWQPDQSAVVVPKSFGLGWTLNLGSVAARARRGGAGRS
jgi:hypothetical protein